MLTSASGSRTMTALDETRNRGLGYALPRAVRWSADNARLYFTNVAAVEGCAWFVNGSDLYSVALATGEVQQLMPDQGPALALSSN